MERKKLIVFIVSILLYNVNCAVFDFENGNIEWVSEFNYADSKISMNIKEELGETITFVNIKCDEDVDIPSLNDISNNAIATTGIKIITADDESPYKFHLTIDITEDYEQVNGKKYEIQMNGKDIFYQFSITLKNVDDNYPYIKLKGDACNVEETAVLHVPICNYEVTDADGFINDILSPLIDIPYNNTFEFVFESPPTSDKKTVVMILQNIAELDYETDITHIFDFDVEDSANHKDSTTAVVKIIDMPDMPPIWKNIRTSIQLKELAIEEYEIIAIDGDYGIKAEISYKFTAITDQLNPYLIKPTESTSGKYILNEIDRDLLEMETFELEVMAYETKDESSFIKETIIIIVEDINNKFPEIKEKDDNFLINIPENKFTKLEHDIIISDKDLGDNARYTVTLKNDVDPDFVKAFRIIPENGYQTSHFSLTIIDSALLDYEIEKFREFTFEIHAVENKDPSHSRILQMNVVLDNWNDELPIFTEDPYVIEIIETTGRGESSEQIIQVIANDRDFGDKVSYSLLGSSILRMLEIDEDGNILTKADSGQKQMFDYEVQPDVLVQIVATDSLGEIWEHHKTVGQVSIKLIDINDETPTIIMGTDAIEVLENQDPGYNILKPTDLRAMDEDGDNKLVFSINWEKSYYTKNGARKTFPEYEKWLDIITVKDSSEVYAQLIVQPMNIKPENGFTNTPDYEIFDAMFLYITVTDEKQVWGVDHTSATLFININNANDNAPIFTEIGPIKKNVKEESVDNTPIATLTAIDDDTEDVIEYSIIEDGDEMQNYKDLVKIDPKTGALYVSGNINADADEDIEDSPALYALNYTVFASDGDIKTPISVSIAVDDTNDIAPKFIVEPNQASVKENTIDEEIIVIKAKDGDRDSPHNVILYSVNSEATEFFNIKQNEETEEWVLYTVNDKLDRDNGEKKHTITIILTDNNGGANNNIVPKSCVITVTDINNKSPLISTKEFTTSENIKKNKSVGEVHAFDEDEANTDNSKIEFHISNIKQITGKEPPTDPMFTISSNENGKGLVTATIDLELYYGTYEITVKTNDLGDPKMVDEKPVTIYIEKYNFRPPTFVFPEDKKYYLKTGQKVNTALKLYDDEPLNVVKAVDNQGDKYTITYSISDDGDIFGINGNIFPDIIYLKAHDENTEYTITITATTDGIPELDPVTVSFKIAFFDKESEPVYDAGVKNVTIEFLENDEELNIYKKTATAKLGMDGEPMDVFYNFHNPPENNKFRVDLMSGDVSLAEILLIEEFPTIDLTIAASTSKDGNAYPADDSKLIVTVILIDVNNNWPEFKKKTFSTGVMASFPLNKVVLTAQATDLDKTDILVYSIKEASYEAIGSDLPTDLKFSINSKNGDISMDFKVQSHMKGYFLFDVHVHDNDTAHEATSKVKIYIITEDHMVIFQFQNEVRTINEKSELMQESLATNLGFVCEVQTIEATTDSNGLPMDFQTNATVNFIDDVKNEPIEKVDIKNKLNDYKLFGELRADLLSHGISLLSFVDIPEIKDIKGMLKAWLIGVSVVLGALCVILVIAFIVKVRQLTQRINKLSTNKFDSQESNLNRAAAAVPNTNRRAVEGANPAFQLEPESRTFQYDQESISSGDSDLVGIENNPDFNLVSEL